jgi:hypothetical protein
MDGDFDGITAAGGAKDDGTVFEVGASLPMPKVSAAPTPTSATAATPIPIAAPTSTPTQAPTATPTNATTAPTTPIPSPTAAPFVIAAGTDGCSGQTVEPKKKSSFKVEFAPTSGGASRKQSATLLLGFTYGANDGNVGLITLSAKVKK